MRKLVSAMSSVSRALWLSAALAVLFSGHPQDVLAEAPVEVPAASPVMLNDQTVFVLRADEGGMSAAERARRASAALIQASHTAANEAVSLERGNTATVVKVGSIPIVALNENDAQLAGDRTLHLYAARIASSVRSSLQIERRRAAAADTVFSVSLVVFFALVTLYLIRKLHEFITRGRTYVSSNPQRIPSLHVSTLEVLGPAALRSLLIVSFSAARWLGTFGLVYAWLVVSMSLFAATRPYTQRLTGLLLSPLSGLVSRLATALPLVVVVLVAISALLLLVRLIGLFFASVERRETRLSWLAPDLAPAASWLVRVAVIVIALVFAAPLITGDTNGALARIGLLVLFSFALGAAPVLASVVVGLSVIFSRGLSIDDIAEYGGERGRVVALGLTVVTLALDDESLVRVPHLRALWHPTRLLTRKAPE
jgi:small-conductance mechanosensitive channel